MFLLVETALSHSRLPGHSEFLVGGPGEFLLGLLQSGEWGRGLVEVGSSTDGRMEGKRETRE